MLRQEKVNWGTFADSTVFLTHPEQKQSPDTVSELQSQLPGSADEGCWRGKENPLNRPVGLDTVDGQLGGGFAVRGVILKTRRNPCLVEAERTQGGADMRRYSRSGPRSMCPGRRHHPEGHL